MDLTHATDVLPMKAWLATVTLALAASQLLTAARIYEWLRFLPKGRLYNAIHRWSGRVAILLTLPIAYHCVFVFGGGSREPRVLVHTILGSTLYVVVAAKVFIVRSSRFPQWVLPAAGAVLFSVLLGLWLTSAFWYFTTGG